MSSEDYLYGVDDGRADACAGGPPALDLDGVDGDDDYAAGYRAGWRLIDGPGLQASQT